MDEVEKLVTNSPSKTCHLDPIPTWLLKHHLPILLPRLAEIINDSLTSGIFPSCLGSASITPILKKPNLDKNELKNYRPISNIRFLAKLIEKAVPKQLLGYIDEHKLNLPLQSAYKVNHSTETALLYLQNDFLQALDNWKAVFVLSLDLSSAFDTLDQSPPLLLTRMKEDYGVTDLVLNWLKTYLANRISHVRLDGESSEDVPLEFGVPQGSVMGPLLFTLYLKPVADILERHNIRYHMYADDIQIYLACDPTQREIVNQTLSKMTTVMSEIKKWMLLNKLKLNQDKTEFFVISSRSHQKHLQNVSIALDDVVLKPSPSVRILGVVFNSQMTTDDQIINVSRNIRYHLRNLGRIRKYLDESRSSAHDAVRALVLSRLDYCNSLLYATTSQNLQRLQLLQNHAVKLVYNKPKFTRVTPLLNDLHWLPISKRIEFKIATLA